MTQRSVEIVLGKLLTDDGFRPAFFASPVAATEGQALDLSTVELEALAHLSERALSAFATLLDPRIRRASPPDATDAHDRTVPGSIRVDTVRHSATEARDVAVRNRDDAKPRGGDS